MKYSIITATLLFKVDPRDCFGFAFSDEINRVCMDRFKKRKLNERVAADKQTDRLNRDCKNCKFKDEDRDNIFHCEALEQYLPKKIKCCSDFEAK